MLRAQIEENTGKHLSGPVADGGSCSDATVDLFFLFEKGKVILRCLSIIIFYCINRSLILSV